MVILPLSPEAVMCCRFIESSLASLRTPGEAKILPPIDGCGSGSGLVSVGCATTGALGSSVVLSTLSSLLSFGGEDCSISSLINRSPTLTSFPVATSTSLTTPSSSDGISIDALSDSKTTIVSPWLSVSPTATDTSLTSAPSIPSPRSGRIISFNDFAIYKLSGLGLLGSILYFKIAFSAIEESNFLSIINERMAHKVI